MALTDESSGIPATMLVGPTGFGGTPYPVYQNGGLIAESDNSKQAVVQMRCDSDTVEAFLQETVVRVDGGRIERGVMFDQYSRYCFQNERQALTRNNFYKSLRAKGISEGRDYSGRFFRDVFLK